MIVARRRLLLLAITASACAPADDIDTSDPGFDSTEVNGVIFKGPFQAGSTLTLTPLTDALEDNGEPQALEVSADDGSYSAEVDIGGLILADARGLALDESQGAYGTDELVLTAYVVAGDGPLDLHVNVLTDLTRQRVEALIRSGTAPAAAIEQAEGELAEALPVGTGGPGARGAQLDPYGDGYAQAWLFAVSAALAQAGRDMQGNGMGDLGVLLNDLRADFADDGALNEALREAIYRGEEHLDPDLATLALGSTLDRAGGGRALPDLHAVLDSDHDGLPNRGDNCRYVANGDQDDSLGLGFGDACDFRLTRLTINDGWGCGLRVSDGTPACWKVDGEPTGGTPPAPDVFPAHVGTPWDGEDKLTGSYVDISVGQDVTCAVQTDGDIRCDVQGEADELVLEGNYERVVASEGTICGLGADGSVACFSPSGVPTMSDPGPHLAVDVFTDGGVCVLANNGALSWLQNSVGQPELPRLPIGAFARLDATETGAGCAISAVDGSIACFGNPALVASAPSGAFVEVAVGSGVACASDAEGALTCWRDEGICPEVEGAPDALTNLSAGGCRVCGLDERGIGHCWPRRWSVDQDK
jgi:hypothetical protein